MNCATPGPLHGSLLLLAPSALRLPTELHTTQPLINGMARTCNVLATILGAYTAACNQQTMIDDIYRRRIRVPRLVEFCLPLMYNFYPFEEEILHKLEESSIVEPIVKVPLARSP